MKGIKISRKRTKKPLFAVGQVIVAYSQDALHVFIRSLETVTSKCGLKISTGKVKTVAFTRRDPVRSKIVISNYRTSEHFHLSRLLFFLPECGIYYC
jgi:hypothetical protein